PGRPVTRERVERKRGDDVSAMGLGEVPGAEAAERAAVRGHEDERVLRCYGARTGGRPVRARELNERRDPRAVVVRTWARAVVVSVREHRDLVWRAAGHRHDLVDE